MVDGGAPVDQAYLDAGEWTVEVAGARYPAVVSLRPLYDPRNERIRM
jgi:4-methylaminobutanoate oxidase (formaldehyde-forming)